MALPDACAVMSVTLAPVDQGSGRRDQVALAAIRPPGPVRLWAVSSEVARTGACDLGGLSAKSSLVSSKGLYQLLRIAVADRVNGWWWARLDAPAHSPNV